MGSTRPVVTTGRVGGLVVQYTSCTSQPSGIGTFQLLVFLAAMGEAEAIAIKPSGAGTVRVPALETVIVVVESTVSVCVL
jgi:hypothetical protein